MIVVTIVVRANCGWKSSANDGRLQRAGGLLLAPHRRLRQERADDDQRDRGNQPGHQRVAPRLVAASDGGKARGVGDGVVIRAGHHQAAERSERLRVADDRLAALRIGEELRQPRDRRDELDADADERADAPEEQLVDRGREAGGERREGVEQDAPGQHAPAPETIGQVAAEQPEDAAEDRRPVEQVARPTG